MHEPRRARIQPSPAGAAGHRTRRAGDHAGDAAGLSAFHLLGVGSEAKNAFERAYALLPRVPEHAMHGRLLHAFGYVLSLRGEHAQALAVAERAEALSSAQNDPVLMLAACFLQGESHHIQGRSQAARSWFERGLAITEALDIAADEVFAADPQVALLGLLAICLLYTSDAADE